VVAWHWSCLKPLLTQCGNNQEESKGGCSNSDVKHRSAVKLRRLQCRSGWRHLFCWRGGFDSLTCCSAFTHLGIICLSVCP
jgi:hypothetical protein